MLDILFRLSLIGILLAGTVALYGTVDYSADLQFEETEGGPLHVLYAQIIFLLVAWFCFLVLVDFRLILLVGFVGGQSLLYVLTPSVHLLGSTYPTYVLVAGNCLYLLALYFFFNADRWTGGDLSNASEYYQRNED